MRIRFILIVAVLVALAFGVGRLSAAVGTLDSPDVPGNTQSFTLADIYNRLDTGVAGAQSTFTEPGAGPGTGTMHDLNEIMAQAPAIDNTDGATETNVLDGKTFWGLTDGQWGLQTGNIHTQTVSNTTVSQLAGYYDAFNLSVVDTDLVSGNIRSTVSIYGVAGDPNVVDTGSGTAAEEDILSGKVAWVDGSEVTGELYGGCTCTGTITPTGGTRWCDNGDGTVTDLLGYNGKGQCLVWLKKADWGGTYAFWVNTASGTNAHDRAAQLWDGSSSEGTAGLSDGSVEGNWRLPTKTELHGLANGTEGVRSGTPRAFSGVQSVTYWSSTTYADNTIYAWSVGLSVGYVVTNGKALTYYVWPVRGGQ